MGLSPKTDLNTESWTRYKILQASFPSWAYTKQANLYLEYESEQINYLSSVLTDFSGLFIVTFEYYYNCLLFNFLPKGKKIPFIYTCARQRKLSQYFPYIMTCKEFPDNFCERGIYSIQSKTKQKQTKTESTKFGNHI